MVSIVIPVYNVENYLKLCLESVRDQEYTDFEVLLVNDGSTDGSPKICEEYAENDSRFKVIHQENKGLASARNTGIRAAKGDFIYFLDSDDSIHPSLLARAVKIAEEENANLVQIELEFVPEEFRDYKKEVPGNYNVQKYSLVQALRNLDEDNLSFGKDVRLTTTVVWTKLYRVSAFQNLLFPEGMRLHEDQMMAHRVIAEAGGMVFLNMPLYFYRQSKASLIRVGWTKKRLAILDCYADRFDCVCNVKEESKEKTDLVNFMYWRYFVCLFRNYCMVSANLKGEEKKANQKEIIKRVKALLKDKRAKTPFAKTAFMKVFCVCPGAYVSLFNLRNKVKKH